MEMATAIGFDMTPSALALIGAGLVAMWLGRPTSLTAASGPSTLLGSRPLMAGPAEALRRLLAALTAALTAAMGRSPSAAIPQRSAVAASPSTTTAPKAGSLRVSRRKSAARAIPVAPLTARLPLDQQWSRVENRLAATVERAGTAARCHNEAQRQLDSADYVLEQLRRELELTRRAPARTAVHAMTIRPRPAPPVLSAAA